MTDVGQELFDVGEVTDDRCEIDQEKDRVTAIDTTFDRHSHRYDQRLTLATP